MAGFGRLRRRITARKLACWLLAASALAAAPALAADRSPGQLDPAFAQRGMLTVPSLEPAPFGTGKAEVARAPEGQLVVLLPEGEATSVLRYLANGRLDPGFGEGGRVRLQAPVAPVEPGYSWFAPAGVAVDETGKIVIAGNLTGTKCLPRCGLILQRLLPNGELDPSFGSGGTTVPDFGFPPVPIAPMTLLGGAPGPESGLATINASAVRLDGAGRIVLAGTVTTAYDWSAKGPGNGYYPVASPLIARLLPGGTVDTTFGTSGATVLTEFERGNSTALALDSHERPVVSVCAPGGSGFVRLGAEGSRQLRFGAGGIAVAAGCPQAIAFDRADRLLALVARGTCGFGAGKICRTVLVRRRTDGTTDRRFGVRGQVRPEARAGTVLVWQDLALDGRGRIDLAGVLAARSAFPAENLYPVAVEVLRVNANGVLENGFGHRGRTAFRPPNLAKLSTYTRARLLLSSGRLLVGFSFATVEFGAETTMVAGFRGG